MCTIQINLLFRAIYFKAIDKSIEIYYFKEKGSHMKMISFKNTMGKTKVTKIINIKTIYKFDYLI